MAEQQEQIQQPKENKEESNWCPIVKGPCIGSECVFMVKLGMMTNKGPQVQQICTFIASTQLQTAILNVLNTRQQPAIIPGDSQMFRHFGGKG